MRRKAVFKKGEVEKDVFVLDFTRDEQGFPRVIIETEDGVIYYVNFCYIRFTDQEELKRAQDFTNMIYSEAEKV